MHGVTTLVLGGGRGERLYPLTRHRSEPAVPVAGKYRLIDIPISNCLNSDFNRVYVVTQYQSVSLHRHIANTYKFDPFGQGFIEVLAAQQTNEAADWYQGTADAVRQNLRYLHEDDARDVLILYGDQLYRMDFRRLLAAHRDSGADATLAVLPVRQEDAEGLGIVRTADDLRVTDLVEKPQRAEQFEALRMPPEWLRRHWLGGGGREWLANMGIYLFRQAALVRMLQERPEATDLVRELCAANLGRWQVRAYPFSGYWQDLGSIRSYHAGNLALAADDPPFDFASPEGVIYTHMRDLPASRLSGADLEECLVSDGCLIEPGARLRRCVIGVRTRIGRGVVLRDTVVNGANRDETAKEREANRVKGVPDQGIGEGSVIEGAILDKNCRVGKGVHVRALPGRPGEDGPNYVVRDGIVVIPGGAVVPDGTVI
jgi:glucose-1-phosphate adenylyltransferase